MDKIDCNRKQTGYQSGNRSQETTAMAHVKDEDSELKQEQYKYKKKVKLRSSVL